MTQFDFSKELASNTYPGRGIMLGRSADGKNAVIVYFIMGRSENSRNRVFVTDGEGIRTQAYDPSKLQDPSLVIYAPVRVFGSQATIVTNGDQTDTIYEYLTDGKTFEDALRTRTFEPDPPNFTPRISGLVQIANGALSYRLSILKSDHQTGEGALRFFYEYEAPKAGEGHFIHTYQCDGNPIPSFRGEPKEIAVENDIDAFASKIWDNLNADNKVSLFVRYIPLDGGKSETRILNKNK